MKKFLAIALSIAFLLIPVYSLQAASVQGFSSEGTWKIADSVKQVEAGIQIIHQGGYWAGQSQDDVSRVDSGTTVDPTNFDVKFTVDKLVDRTARAISPWNGNMDYDSWIIISLLDKNKSFEPGNSTDTRGIATQLIIHKTDADGNNTMGVQGQVFVDGGGWQWKFGDYSSTTWDPLGKLLDFKFYRGTDGKYNLAVNDFVAAAPKDFDTTVFDKLFFNGSNVFTPSTDALGNYQYKQFIYSAVAPATAVAVAGQVYVPAVTSYPGYIGPELTIMPAATFHAAVTSAAATWGYVVHPSITPTDPIMTAGKTYVPGVTAYAGAVGPENSLFPEVTAHDPVVATDAYTTVKQATYVINGATVVAGANMIGNTTFVPQIDPVTGAKVLKSIYFKVNMSSLVPGAMQITVTSLNGKSFFKDMTPPIITGVENYGYYSDPTVTISEQGEGVIEYAKTAGNWTDGWAHDFDSGSMITSEGQNMVYAKSVGVDQKTTVYFTVDDTPPVVTATAGGKAVANNSKVTGPVTITVADDNLLSKAIYSPSGKKITWPKSNTFSAKSTYSFVAIDKAGNTTKLAFTIK